MHESSKTGLRDSQEDINKTDISPVEHPVIAVVLWVVMILANSPETEKLPSGEWVLPGRHWLRPPVFESEESTHGNLILSEDPP